MTINKTTSALNGKIFNTSVLFVGTILWTIIFSPSYALFVKPLELNARVEVLSVNMVRLTSRLDGRELVINRRVYPEKGRELKKTKFLKIIVSPLDHSWLSVPAIDGRSRAPLQFLSNIFFLCALFLAIKDLVRYVKSKGSVS